MGLLAEDCNFHMRNTSNNTTRALTFCLLKLKAFFFSAKLYPVLSQTPPCTIWLPERDGKPRDSSFIACSIGLWTVVDINLVP